MGSNYLLRRKTTASRSIATRTLAIVASLWSPSSLSLSSSAPQTTAWVEAFQPATNLYPNRIRHCYNSRRTSCRLQHPHRRLYHSTTLLQNAAPNTEPSSSSSLSTGVSDKTEGSRHLPRLYIDSISPSSSSTEHPSVPLRERSLVPLTVDQEHYLLDVMRITNPKRWGRNKKQQEDINDDLVDYTGCVRVFNGIDGEWLAKVVVQDPGNSTNGNKKQRRKRGGKQTNSDDNSSSGTVLECLEQLITQPSDDDSKTISVHLYLGYLKDKQRRRWVFEKATELGTDGITILETDFSSNAESNNYKSKDFRWEDDRDKHKLHVIEAAEQCERLTVPEISQEARSIPSIVSTIDIADSKDIWLVCRERSESSPPILSALQDLLPTSGITTTIHVLVGPEGGWSPGELETFSNLQRVQFVSLGSSVLRAETAAITAVASIQMYEESMS